MLTGGQTPCEIKAREKRHGHLPCDAREGINLIHSDEEYLVVTRKINIFALYNGNKHSMLRQKREKSGTGICHMNGEPRSQFC